MGKLRVHLLGLRWVAIVPCGSYVLWVGLSVHAVDACRVWATLGERAEEGGPKTVGDRQTVTPPGGGGGGY